MEILRLVLGSGQRLVQELGVEVEEREADKELIVCSFNVTYHPIINAIQINLWSRRRCWTWYNPNSGVLVDSDVWQQC